MNDKQSLSRADMLLEPFGKLTEPIREAAAKSIRNSYELGFQDGIRDAARRFEKKVDDMNNEIIEMKIDNSIN